MLMIFYCSYDVAERTGVLCQQVLSRLPHLGNLDGEKKENL